MGLKNINALEQHVEKIVIGVAAAGALFMGYLATQKVGIPDPASGDTIGPRDIETRIGDAIGRMERKREELEAKGRPRPVIRNLLIEYQQASSGQPIDPQAVAYRPPEFSPRNLHPSGTSGPDVGSDGLASVVPPVPKPILVRAEAMLLQVGQPLTDPATGQIMPLPAGMQVPVESRNVVVIEGWIPVGDFLLPMLAEKENKKRFNAEVLKAVVYRVRVQRSELLAGGWTNWQDIAPTKGSPAPTDVLPRTLSPGELPSRLLDIENQYQIIQLPTFYVDAQGVPVQPPITTTPIPKEVQDRSTKLQTDIEAARVGAVAASGPFRMLPTSMPSVMGVVGTQPAAGLLTAEQIKAMPIQPFAFWDEAVQPGRNYKYQVQIQLVNPGFGWQFGLADKTLKEEPVVPVKDEGMVAANGGTRVFVPPDMVFFVRGPNFGGTGIGGRIYKQLAGRWYWNDFSAQPGMNISTLINFGGKSEQVDTKFALVDYSVLSNPSNVRVVLKDSAGNLLTRDSAEDWSQKENDELYGKARAAAAAEAAAVAATAPATMPVTPTTVPATGRAPR